MFKKILISCVLFSFVLPLFAFSESSANVIDYDGLHTEAEIAQLREVIEDGDYPKGFMQFFSYRATPAMSRTPSAPVDFYVPGYYRDEPNSTKNAELMTGDGSAAYTLALAYRLTGTAAYAQKAVEILNNWATVNKTISTVDDTPLVCANKGVGLIHAAELLEPYANWTASERGVFNSWVTNKYLPVIRSIAGRPNNWSCWATLALITTYCYLNDINGINVEITHIKTIIDNQIAADGHMPEEVSRKENGIWYTYFALAPLTAAAQVAYHAVGAHVYEYQSPSGASIKKALDYLLPYIKKEKVWPHYTTVYSFTLGNGVNAGNYPTNLYAAMGSVYHDPAYQQLVAQYVPILGGWSNSKPHHIAWNYPTLMQPKYSSFTLEQPVIDTSVSNKITVRTNLIMQYNDASPINIIVAAYDTSNKLISIQSTTYNNTVTLPPNSVTPHTVEFNTQGVTMDKVKVFCWGDFAKIRPTFQNYVLYVD